MVCKLDRYGNWTWYANWTWYGNVGWFRTLQSLVTKITMSIPTIQTHCIELAIFDTKTQCQYQPIKNTMHGIANLDGMEIGHGMEMCDGMEIGHGIEMCDGMEIGHGMFVIKITMSIPTIKRTSVASKNCAISDPLLNEDSEHT